MNKAEALNRRAYAIDALSPRVVLGMVRTLYTVGKFSEARAVAEDALANLAGHQYALVALAEYHLASGDLRDADQTLARLDPGTPTAELAILQLSWLLKDRVTFDEAVARVSDVDRLGQPFSLFLESYVSFLQGDLIRARENAAASVAAGIQEVQLAWYRPLTLQHLAESSRHAWVNHSAWVEDYPAVIAGYQTLGIDIVAEIQAAQTPP
ncbi:MAG: hypothetical protein QNJ40_21225 [Xanthomonadales bacterium]|nr:hypothetical protein [Xanthomonadales bacterium]